MLVTNSGVVMPELSISFLRSIDLFHQYIFVSFQHGNSENVKTDKKLFL